MADASGDEHGIVEPMADYATVTVHNGVVYTAGMTPRTSGGMAHPGIVGDGISVEQASAAAAIAAERALNAIAQRVPCAGITPLQMTVYIAAAPGIDGLSAVADGASAVVSARTGSVPARTAVGVAQLPGQAPVEVTLIAALAAL